MDPDTAMKMVMDWALPIMAATAILSLVVDTLWRR